MVTARFKVSRKTALGVEVKPDGSPIDPDKGTPWGYEIELTPDYADGANKAWSQATPAGMCRLTITNPGAYDYFNQGDPVELTFNKLED